MSTAPRPQQPVPSSAAPRSGSTTTPAPPSILMKQSSFSKNKNPQAPQGTPNKAANGSAPSSAGGPPAQGQPARTTTTTTTPQTRPTAAAAPGPQARPPGTAATPQTRTAAPSSGAGAKGPAMTPMPAVATKGPAMTPSAAAKSAPPPGMWGPNGEIAPDAGPRPAGPPQPQPQGPLTMAGAAPATNPATAAGPRATPAAANGSRAPAAAPTATPRAAANPGGMQRQNSFGGLGGGSQFGSMGAGQMPSTYGSMGPGAMLSAGPQGYGSMGPGAMPSIGPQGYGTMGPQGYGSMGPNAMGGYGSMGPGGMPSMGPQGYGSMGPGGAQGGSMYGGSMMGGNSFFGSQYGSMGPGSLGGGGAGSLYGMPGVNRTTSAYGFAAQWGSLANMSSAPDRSGISRSDITSSYGGFVSEAKGYRMEDLCPNIGSLEEGEPVKRSGRRGGNHLYSRDKNDRSAPVITSNSRVNTMTIKRKDSERSTRAAADGKSPATATDSGSRSRGGITASSSDRKVGDGKGRAKLPGNYDLHTLFVVDKAAAGGVQVRDPNTVVIEKDGKKETFETDEALLRERPTDDVDSVLLSSVLTSWHGGHNSSLLVGGGKGKAQESVQLAHDFVKGAVERLEKTASSNYFDISINMVSIRGANQGCDLLKPGASYAKLQLGSSPVYGPCLLDLETKVVKSAKECMKVLEDGMAAAKEAKEVVAAFLVLKQSKKGGDKEVRLSSLCIGYVREELKHLTDMKEKNSSSPHQLFRYAIGGASVTVSALVLAGDDDTARACLDVERKMREVKNRAPRSGNLQKFVEYTQKEVTRMKEKAASSASESEKKRTEVQVKKMEDMIADTEKILADPENSKPIGYPLPS